MSLIDVRGITKVYAGEGVSHTAVQDVSFEVAKGEFISVMGPSGSGKSTVLHILGFLDRPTNGEYIFEDSPTSDLSDEQRARIRNEEIGFVFQTFHLLPRANVLENVMMPLLYSRIPRSEHRNKAIAALEHVNMTHRLEHTPSQLSGGEKQRTAIARALVNEPAIIFADEPTGNLDSVSGEMVMQVIDNLHKQGHTVVLITHETPTAEYAQRILRLEDGKIVSDTPVAGGHHHYTK